MRSALLLALATMLALVPAAFAQEGQDAGNATVGETPAAAPEPVHLTLTTASEGGDYVWKGADGARNPTLRVPPGATVTITATNQDGGFHAITVGSNPKSDDFPNQGDSVEYTFTAPESGTLPYVCPYHLATMKGTIQVEAGAPAGGEQPAPAQGTPAPTSITLIAHGEGSSYWWTLEGQTQRNPTIIVAPESDITVTIKNANAMTHNFATTHDAKGSDYVQNEGDVVTYTFRSGAEGESLEYFCVPHRASGMKGAIKFQAEIAPPSAGGGDAGDGGITGEAIDLGQYDQACAGKMAPAIVTRNVVGGGTLADYIAKCKAGDAAISSEQPPHPADYVIPLSWLLIGLGIVGVVWVHKYYKP